MKGFIFNSILEVFSDYFVIFTVHFSKYDPKHQIGYIPDFTENHYALIYGIR